MESISRHGDYRTPEAERRIRIGLIRSRHAFHRSMRTINPRTGLSYGTAVEADDLPFLRTDPDPDEDGNDTSN